MNELAILLLQAAVAAMKSTPAPAPAPAPAPVPPMLQQLIQQMNREGAQFDMPPAQPSVYDKLSEHLAALYSNSNQQ